MPHQEPKHSCGEAGLKRSTTFFRWDQLGGRCERQLPAGAIVEVRRVEAIIDDHGRFDRYWYHLVHDIFWSAIVEEDELTRPDVLDRLAAI
jgi:hypothetical protein